MASRTQKLKMSSSGLFILKASIYFVIILVTFYCPWFRCNASDATGGTVVAAERHLEPGGSTGRLTGKIIDKFSGTELVEAGVEAKKVGQPDGTGEFTLTDINGKYSIELPPGAYDILVTYPRYQTQVIKETRIKSGDIARVNVALAPVTVEIDEMKIVERADRAAEEFQLVLRRKSSNIVDNIGAEMITKLPDGDAGGLLTRVAGISMTEGKFMQARGMPKRYGRTLLNGAVIPTTRPNEKLVPLDLFPSGLIEAMSVSKSFSPDQPGNYAGGLAQITTKDFPDKFEAAIGCSLGGNTETTFKDFDTYHGGDWDWLGFDDGTRDMPGAIPGSKVVGQGLFTPGLTPEELQAIGRSFDNSWNIHSKTAPLNPGFNLYLGNRKNRLGYSLALTYKNEFQNQKEEQNTYAASTGGLTRLNDYDFHLSTNYIKEGGIINVGYEVTPNHRLYFRNFYNRNAEKETRFYEGWNEDMGTDINDTRLKWSEEEIYSGQLAGEHHFADFLDCRIDWRFNHSIANLDEPDLREYLYEYNESLGAFVLADETQSAFRMFTEQDEDIDDMALDWTLDVDILPDVRVKLKSGAAYLKRDRDFESRRFRFVPITTMGIDLSEDTESILAPDNIRPDGFEIVETTRETDTYKADQTVAAGYAMGDFALGEAWRMTAGARFEKSKINVKTFDPFELEDIDINTKLDDKDWLPSVNLNYGLLDGMNIRLGFSRTVSRPEFHELSPFEFTDVRGGRAIIGNPDLVSAKIRNYDIRYEWFIGPSELFAISLFMKDIEDPIERTVQATTLLRTSFVNSDDADLMGLELEIRKKLDFLSPSLHNFTFIGNYTFTDSEVTMTPEPGFVPTSEKRSLEGQPDHLLNAIIEYDNPDQDLIVRLLYNYMDERINDVGAMGLPDIMLEPVHDLDVVLKKRIGKYSFGLNLENLLDEPYEETQSGQVVRKYRTGQSFSMSLTYTWQ
ncbi:MAG: TonB-dependent receptor [Thermodesulfobacteriota bacterium]|nr:TonB-dependent receptor [Thermodesulfobacteriota bacterium]